MVFKPVRCLLFDILKRYGMSKTELAELLGVSKSSITEWCDFKYVMSYDAAYNISLIFDCEMKDLYEWKKTVGI